MAKEETLKQRFLSTSHLLRNSVHSVKFKPLSLSTIETPEKSSSSGSEEMVKRREELSSSEDIDVDSIVSEINDYIIVDAVPKTSLDEFAERIFGDITKSSACKQLAIGGASGWVAGYMANSIGKFAALSLGSTLLLFQLAQHNGYISVDWTKVKHALTKAQAKAKLAMLKRQKGVIEKGRNFYEENFFLASGFAAGFLVGFIW